MLISMTVQTRPAYIPLQVYKWWLSDHVKHPKVLVVLQVRRPTVCSEKDICGNQRRQAVTSPLLFLSFPPSFIHSDPIAASLCLSYREGTNDGSMSAQSAVTETSLNLSLPLSHPIHPRLLSLSPPPCILVTFPFSSLSSLHLLCPISSSPVISMLWLSPSPPSLFACGVMIALCWFCSGVLPAAFHTLQSNDWNWRSLFPCG